MQLRAAAGQLDAQQPPRRPRVLILTGPTGVGKTDTSLLLAERLGGEIISADSVQVYRGLDIGSDTLPVSERRGIPHHLLDILDPAEDFSAGDFHDRAHAATRDILSRGKLPIVVGGTGFYLRMFIFGKPLGGQATADEAEQARRLLADAKEARARREGVAVAELDAAAAWDACTAVLQDLGDSEGASRVREEPNNWYRLERAIQILLRTGAPTSTSHMQLERPWSELPYDFRPFFITRPRLEVFRRIDERVERMILGGLLPELEALQEQGFQADTNSATRSIGYRQGLKWLQDVRKRGAASAADIKQLALDIQGPSRRLHKAQVTFHRDTEHFHWVDASAGPEAAAARIERQLQLEEHQGYCGDSGRLSKDQQNEIKRYQTEFKHLHQQANVDRVVQWLQQNGYVE